MQRIKIINVLIFLALGLVSGFFFLVRADEENIENKNIKAVKVESVKLEKFQNFNEYSGFIKGESQTSLAPKINGRLVSILKNEGDRVKKGETIAILNADEIVSQSQTIKQTINALYKNLDQTEKYYKQKVDEAKDGTASNEEIKSAKRLRDLQAQAVETEIIRMQGGFNEVQSLVKETIIRAPFDGVITKIFGEVGQLTGPTTPVCEVADDSQLVVEVFVPREILSQLAKKQKVQALCGDMKKECQGEIDTLGVITQSNGQKALAKVVFEKNNPEIYLGQYVILQLANEVVNNQVVINEKSIISKYDEKFVFVEMDGKVQERKIYLGNLQNGKAEVLTGITQGEKIVIEGMNKLRDGDNVKVYE
jgi:RND family efflux transporter MFP subunit